MKEENVIIFCFLAVLLLSVVFVVENQATQISSLKRVYDYEIECLRAEVKKKTVPHFYFERGAVYSGNGEIVIEKLK